MPPRTQPARQPSGCFLILFLSIWLPVTGAFDVMIGYGVWQQCWAWTFAETTGTVVSSRVVTSTDSEGDSHRLAVQYRYTVNGGRIHF